MRQPHSFFPVDSLRAAPTSSLWFGAMTLLSGSCMVEVVHVGLVHVSGVLDHCAVKQRAQRHSISSLDYVSFPCHHSDDRSCCCWHAWFLLRFPANHLVPSTFATRPCISRRGPPLPPGSLWRKRDSSARTASFSSPASIRSVQHDRLGRTHPTRHPIRRILPLKGWFFLSRTWKEREGKKDEIGNKKLVVRSTRGREFPTRSFRRKKQRTCGFFRSFRCTWT